MKQKEGNQGKADKSYAPGEEAAIGTDPFDEISYEPEQSENVFKTLDSKKRCLVTVKFTPLHTGMQKLVATFTCDGISQPVVSKTGTVKVQGIVYLVIAEASGRVAFIKIGGRNGQERTITEVKETLVKEAKVAWNHKSFCVWLGKKENDDEYAEGDYAKFAKGVIEHVAESETYSRDSLRSLRWSTRLSEHYAVGDANTLIHTKTLTAWTTEDDLSAVEIEAMSDFRDIACPGKGAASKLDYVIVGTNGVLITGSKDNGFVYDKTLAGQLEGASINCIAYSDTLNCFLAIAKVSRSSKLKNGHVIISDLTRPTQWEVIESSELSDAAYEWSRITWSEPAKKFVCVGKDVVASSSDAKTWKVQKISEILKVPDIVLNEVVWTDLWRGGFFAVGTHRCILYSPDGDNWGFYIKPEAFKGTRITEDSSFTGVDVVESPQ